MKKDRREDLCCNTEGDLNQFEELTPENVDYYILASNGSSYIIED